MYVHTHTLSLSHTHTHDVQTYVYTYTHAHTHTHTHTLHIFIYLVTLLSFFHIDYSVQFSEQAELLIVFAYTNSQKSLPYYLYCIKS